MSRLSVETEVFDNLVESQLIPCPESWKKAETAIIRLEVLDRDPSIGTVNYDKLIAREFTGFWYLLSDNYVVLNGKIDFRNMELYNNTQRWWLEDKSQESATRVPIPETTQPEENVEEVAELALTVGETIVDLIADLNIPVVGNVAEKIAEIVDSISSDDLYYLPFPIRPDTLGLSFPTGDATIRATFYWYRYSPLALGGGLGELDIEEQIETPNLPEAEEITSPIPQLSFLDRARREGLIPISECEATPNLYGRFRASGINSGADGCTAFSVEFWFSGYIEGATYTTTAANIVDNDNNCGDSYLTTLVVFENDNPVALDRYELIRLTVNGQSTDTTNTGFLTDQFYYEGSVTDPVLTTTLGD